MILKQIYENLIYGKTFFAVHVHCTEQKTHSKIKISFQLFLTFIFIVFITEKFFLLQLGY